MGNVESQPVDPARERTLAQFVIEFEPYDIAQGCTIHAEYEPPIGPYAGEVIFWGSCACGHITSPLTVQARAEEELREHMEGKAAYEKFLCEALPSSESS